MHKSESVLENKTQKVIWDFKIRLYRLILDRWSDLEKKNLSPSGLNPADHKKKIKESKKIDKY